MARALINKTIVILILIIILATVIRIVALFNFGTYTFDDMFSVYFSHKDLPKMFSLLKEEVHPPLYYFLLHFWIKIFGETELVTRLLSLIFNVCAIPLFYYLAKELLNKWIGILASIIFALSYFQIFTAVQVRMYSLLTFLGLASLVLFWLIIIKQKKQFWILYIVTSSLMLLTHLGGIFGLITQWFWLIILIGKKQIAKPLIKKYLVSQVLILLIWSFWLIPFFLPKLSNIITQGWYFKAEISRRASLGLYDYFFLLLKNYWLRFITGIIIFSAPFIILLWPDKKVTGSIPGQTNPNWFLFAWLLPAFLVAVITKINITRIYVLAYLSVYLIVAYFFYIVFKNNKRLFWLMIVVWFLISFFNLGQNLGNNFSRWDLANNWLVNNERPGDKIIIFNFFHQFQFQYYYTGNINYEGLYLLSDNKTLEQRIIEKNWQNVVTAKNINQLDKLVNDSDRILLLREASPPDNYFNSLVYHWFEKNNWQITDLYQPKAFFGPKIIVYSKK